MQKGTWITIGVLVAVLLVGGYFLMNQRGGSVTNTETSAPTSQNTPPSSAVETDDALEITVEGTEFSYSPSTFNIKVGQKVRVLFKNVGKMDHDFVVEELGVRTKIIAGGEEDTLEFVAPATAGKLTFYCSIGAHRANGMEGIITVE